MRHWHSLDILDKRIGRIEEVLLESEEHGRTSANFITRLDRTGTGPAPYSDTGLRRAGSLGETATAVSTRGSIPRKGGLVRVEITGVQKNTLRGRLIS